MPNPGQKQALHPVDKYLIHIATILVTASGLIWGWTLYFCQPTGEFSLWNHPWQQPAQNVHLLSAPLFILGIGLIARGHLWHHLKSKSRRRIKSGLVLLFLLLPMVISGYLLQICSDERGRQIALFVHLASSGCWILAWIAHHVCGRKST